MNLRTSRRRLLLFSLLLALEGGCAAREESPPQVPSFSFAYFPNRSFLAPSGERYQLLFPPEGVAPRNFLGQSIDWRDLFSRYDGFSIVQPILLKVRGNCPRLPAPGEESWSVADTAPVLLWEGGRRERIPWFGEPGEDPRYCMVFPLKGFSPQGEVFVGVTGNFTGALEAEGSYAPVPGELASFPFRLTFSFPVGSLTQRVLPLYRLREAALRWLEKERTPLLLELNPDPPEGFVQNYPGKLLAFKGYYRVPWFLGPQGTVVWDEAGEPVLQGEFREQFFVMIPASITGESEIPLVQYGHGLFGDPREIWYGDQRNLIRITGGVFAAVPWGMAIRYFHRAAVALMDPTEIVLLRDMVFQGMVNQLVFTFFYRTELKALLEAQLGRGVSSEVDYIGISQGGILGAVLLALDPFLRRGVLHVGGGGWTPMMTHSSNWKREQGLGYGDAVKATIPDPEQRTQLFALWQSIWDEWDPAVYAAFWHRAPLTGLPSPPSQRQVYYPYAIADPQVPNFSSETVLRTAGIPLLTPSITTPYGIALASYPGSFTQAAAQWDVGPGEPAHSEPRKLNEFGKAVRNFIRNGTLLDPCEGRPCRFQLTPEPVLLP